ncbi:MAG: hypothetical protein H0X30_02355 [Anaerolineae bacterium]|nr:hypothetical protein [Anaerolineae bacterium]
MKQNARLGITLSVFALMALLALPTFNVMANCFGGCDPTPTPPPMIIIPTAVPDIDMDTTVSFNDSDVGVVLYKMQGDASDIKMDVYGLKNGGTMSSYLFTVSQEDLARFAKNHPAKNTLIATMDNVSVYVLTTGEIQVNAGPDSEGKMHVKILDSIPWTKVYGYTVDAQ